RFHARHSTPSYVGLRPMPHSHLRAAQRSWTFRSEIAEQVDETLFVEVREEFFGHERELRFFDLLDLVTRHEGLLALRVDDRERLGCRIDDESRQHATVPQLNEKARVFLADRRARIDDVLHQDVQVAPLGSGQVRTDRTSLAEERVTAPAALREDLF